MADTECFADSILGCRILIEGECEGCSFYKSKEEYEKENKRIKELLKALPENKQQHISEKYYQNKKPWSDD